MQSLSIVKGMRTNFYAAAEEFLPQLQWLSELKFDGGCYLFHEKENQIDLYFFLDRGERRNKSLCFPSLYFWERSA